MKYGHKMETMLVEMQKLLPGPSTPGTSQPPPQAAVSPSPKGKAQQMLDDLKGCLRERKVQEAMAAAAKIVVPTPEVSPTAVPEATPKGKSKEKNRNPEQRVLSPLLRRAERKRRRCLH